MTQQKHRTYVRVWELRQSLLSGFCRLRGLYVAVCFDSKGRPNVRWATRAIKCGVRPREKGRPEYSPLVFGKYAEYELWPFHLQ